MKRFLPIIAIALVMMQSCCQATQNEINELPVRNASILERLYQDVPKHINPDTPDMLFANALCSGNSDNVVSLFRDKKMFLDEPSAVDTPYDRFEGINGIKEFADGFLARFNATSVTFTPVFQTFGGGRICLEGVFKFVVDEAINEVPFFIVADLRAHTLLDEVRMYTHFSYVPGQTPYRKPIFKSAHYEMGDPGLLTGAMRAYYEALHHAPYCVADKIHAVFANECIVGGYEPANSEIMSKEEMSEYLHTFGYSLASYIPACVGMRYETIIDDGTTCVIEWSHIVSKQGQEERNRVAMAGVSAYSVNEEGFINSVRICDYSSSTDIDWSQTPISKEEAQKINYVDVFPAGCGYKAQEEY